MKINVRAETKEDYTLVRELLRQAFAQEGEATGGEATGGEARLVENLRANPSFIPELSFVAEAGGKIAGFLLLFPITIKGENQTMESLALAPVAVMPENQGQGIGSELIRVALTKARESGHGSVIVLGHADYYPRFGFMPASRWNIKAPFLNVPEGAFMALELKKGALSDISGTGATGTGVTGGTVIYPEEFNEV